MKDEATSTLRELVRIPSVTDDLAAYEKIATYIATSLQDAGYTSTIIESIDGRKNVVCRRKFGTGKRLLFNGHTDVVPVADRPQWRVDPFAGTLENDRIVGRGACDMKGGLTSMMIAAKALDHLPEALHGEIICTGTVDEEIGGFKGLKHVLEQGVTADFGIVCEPSNLKTTVSCKGPMWLKIVTKGKAAHGSMPHLGKNAIEEMLTLLNSVLKIDFGVKEHKLLGMPTINIGTIQAGPKPNIVPDLCTATLDIRILPSQTVDDTVRLFKDKIRHVADGSFDWDLELLRYREPVEIQTDSEIVRVINHAAKLVTGSLPENKGAVSPGDMQHLIKAGIPSVTFGPGDDELAHTANESIPIRDVLEAAKVYVVAACELLS